MLNQNFSNTCSVIILKHHVLAVAFLLLCVTTSYGFLNSMHHENALTSRQAAPTKWIVLTTVNAPTDAVKILASQKGWRLVVVADKKTPADWKHPNCDFLSIEKQEMLNYHISAHVPYYSYTRKMIGYLYAIQKGAEWIYDTDDDNQPFGSGLHLFDMDINKTFITGLSYGDSSVERSNCGKLSSLIIAVQMSYNAPAIWKWEIPTVFWSENDGRCARVAKCRRY